MRITLEALQILDAIDARGSFAAAAEALYRVPSALTHAIKKLEDDLAVTLFVREGRRAVLTPAGRTLLDEGRHLLRAAGDLECRVKRIATGWENELRIALDAVVDARDMLPLVDLFYRETAGEGGTRIRLIYEVLGGTWDALVTGRADLAVAALGDAPAGGGIRTLPFGEVEFVFAVAPGHPLATAAEPLAERDIASHRAVVVSDTSRQLLAREAGLIGGQEILVVPDPAAKLAAQLAGMGVGYLLRPIAEREALAGRLVIKQVAASRPVSPAHLAWRSDHEGRAVSWFIRQLADPRASAALLRGRTVAGANG
jgi:DNA-binding transcriptional LysR family regulator